MQSIEREGEQYNNVDSAGVVVLTVADSYIGPSDGRIKDAIVWLQNNPREFTYTYRELDTVYNSYNAFMVSPPVVNEDRLMASEFKKALRNQPFMTPTQIIDKKDIQVFRVADKTFNNVGSKFKDREWAIPGGLDDPIAIVTGIIVKTHAQLLEDYYEISGLSAKFMVGFEEILARQFPSSAVLKAFSPWMLDFSLEDAYREKDLDFLASMNQKVTQQ